MPLPRLLAPTLAAGSGLLCDCPEPFLNMTCFGASSPVEAWASCPSPMPSSSNAVTQRPRRPIERRLRIVLIFIELVLLFWVKSDWCPLDEEHQFVQLKDGLPASGAFACSSWRFLHCVLSGN